VAFKRSPGGGERLAGAACPGPGQGADKRGHESRVTHLYSCTSMFTRRDGVKRMGTLETALMTDGVAVEVIADGLNLVAFFP